MKKKNVFISHYWKDDAHVQQLKKRLIDAGYDIRNYSVDSTKHRKRKRPSVEVIKRFLRRQVSWSSTVICLIGPKTHLRDWVNYEIKQAHLQGKKIVGIYTHGNKENAEVPENMQKYGGPLIGWNSIEKLGDILHDENFDVENPDGSMRSYPRVTVPNISC